MYSVKILLLCHIKIYVADLQKTGVKQDISGTDQDFSFSMSFYNFARGKAMQKFLRS